MSAALLTKRQVPAGQPATFSKTEMQNSPFLSANFRNLHLQKTFVEFVALIYWSYIDKKMIDGHLYSQYTMHELLDELDVIECYLEPGKAPAQGEVLMKQEQLYRDLGVNPLLARQK